MMIANLPLTAEPIHLVRGRWVFTGDQVITDGAVAIQGDRILSVESWQKLSDRYPGAAVIGSSQHAILPGLINAHHHSNGVPNSLMGVEDDLLELWLYARNGARSQDIHSQTLLSATALLKSGVTTVLDVTTLGGSVARSRQNLQSQLQAYAQAGIRAVLAPGARYDSFLVHGEGQDDAFLATLPTALRQQVKASMPGKQGLAQADYLEIVSAAVRQYHAHPHIDVWFGPPGPQWVGDELLLKIVEAAHYLDTGVQTHALESFYEKLMGPRLYGKSVIAHLHELGVLSPRFSIAHGVWVSESDVEILAETGASISHNPSSNLRLRAGIAPLNYLLASGVTMGLGMDGTTLNDDEDMFTEMRLATRLQQTPQLQGSAATFQQIFQMATAGGANLLLKADSIGKLAPGYCADMVLVNGDRLTWPYLAPEADLLTVMMMRARSADVDTVLVNGKIVLKGGEPTGVDLVALGETVAAQLESEPDRAEYRHLAQSVRPYLAKWYADWEVPMLTPFAAFNSRQ